MAQDNAPNGAQLLRVQLTDMAYGGDAVGRDPASGLALFAWPAIEGEKATINIVERRKNLLRGLVIEIEEPSPLRAVPQCPYFGACGGCQWQHIEYAAQVRFKEKILRSQLQRTAGVENLDALVKPSIGSPLSYNYRNTSHFAIEANSKRLGYFRRDSHSIVPVDSCPISNEGINDLIPIVNKVIEHSLVADAGRNELRGIMRVWKVALRFSADTGQSVVVFHSKASGQARPSSAHAARRRPQHGGRPDAGPNANEDEEANPVTLLVRREVRRAVTSALREIGSDTPIALTLIEVMDDGTVNLLGGSRSANSLAADAMADALTGVSLRDSATQAESAEANPPLGAWVERLGGRIYWVAPDAFFQANTQAAELLLKAVLEETPRKVGLVVDAHAGVGTFGLAIAPRAGHVVGFETDSSAVTSARWTAITSQTHNADFRQGRAELLLPRLSTSEAIDMVVLDPPRSGCHPGLLGEISRRQVPHIVYVSCDPGSLARDIKLLSPGYTLSSVCMIDMFPQTFHMETVAVLDRTRSG